MYLDQVCMCVLDKLHVLKYIFLRNCFAFTKFMPWPYDAHTCACPLIHMYIHTDGTWKRWPSKKVKREPHGYTRYVFVFILFVRVYVPVWVCIYVYIYMYVCMYIYTYIAIKSCASRTGTRVVCLCLCVFSPRKRHVCTPQVKWACVCAYVCVCMCGHRGTRYAYIHFCMYASNKSFVRAKGRLVCVCAGKGAHGVHT
jgi:hypothetical protein